MNQDTKYHLQAEYRRRLIRLRDEIDEAIIYDSDEKGLYPALFNIISFLWFNMKLK